MSQPIRRIRVLDIGLSALILCLLSGISLGILFTDRSPVKDEGMRVAVAICLSAAAALFFVGGVPLLYYWRKDFGVDRLRMSTLTTRELRTVMLLMVLVVFGCVAFLVAEIIEVVESIRTNLTWQIAFGVFVVLLIAWVILGITQTALLFNDASREAAARDTTSAQSANRGVQVPRPEDEEDKDEDPNTVI